jgi:hypothetical protein
VKARASSPPLDGLASDAASTDSVRCRLVIALRRSTVLTGPQSVYYIPAHYFRGRGSRADHAGCHRTPPIRVLLPVPGC